MPKTRAKGAVDSVPPAFSQENIIQEVESGSSYEYSQGISEEDSENIPSGFDMDDNQPFSQDLTDLPENDYTVEDIFCGIMDPAEEENEKDTSDDDEGGVIRRLDYGQSFSSLNNAIVSSSDAISISSDINGGVEAELLLKTENNKILQTPTRKSKTSISVESSPASIGNYSATRRIMGSPGGIFGSPRRSNSSQLSVLERVLSMRNATPARILPFPESSSSLTAASSVPDASISSSTALGASLDSLDAGRVPAPFQILSSWPLDLEFVVGARFTTPEPLSWLLRVLKEFSYPDFSSEPSRKWGVSSDLYNWWRNKERWFVLNGSWMRSLALMQLNSLLDDVSPSRLDTLLADSTSPNYMDGLYLSSAAAESASTETPARSDSADTLGFLALLRSLSSGYSAPEGPLTPLELLESAGAFQNFANLYREELAKWELEASAAWALHARKNPTSLKEALTAVNPVMYASLRVPGAPSSSSRSRSSEKPKVPSSTSSTVIKSPRARSEKKKKVAEVSAEYLALMLTRSAAVPPVSTATVNVAETATSILTKSTSTPTIVEPSKQEPARRRSRASTTSKRQRDESVSPVLIIKEKEPAKEEIDPGTSDTSHVDPPASVGSEGQKNRQRTIPSQPYNPGNNNVVLEMKENSNKNSSTTTTTIANSTKNSTTGRAPLRLQQPGDREKSLKSPHSHGLSLTNPPVWIPGAQVIFSNAQLSDFDTSRLRHSAFENAATGAAPGRLSTHNFSISSSVRVSTQLLNTAPVEDDHLDQLFDSPVAISKSKAKMQKEEQNERIEKVNLKGYKNEIFTGFTSSQLGSHGVSKADPTVSASSSSSASVPSSVGKNRRPGEGHRPGYSERTAGGGPLFQFVSGLLETVDGLPRAALERLRSSAEPRLTKTDISGVSAWVLRLRRFQETLSHAWQLLVGSLPQMQLSAAPGTLGTLFRSLSGAGELSETPPPYMEEGLDPFRGSKALPYFCLQFTGHAGVPGGGNIVLVGLASQLLAVNPVLTEELKKLPSQQRSALGEDFIVAIVVRSNQGLRDRLRASDVLFMTPLDPSLSQYDRAQSAISSEEELMNEGQAAVVTTVSSPSLTEKPASIGVNAAGGVLSPPSVPRRSRFGEEDEEIRVISPPPPSSEVTAQRLIPESSFPIGEPSLGMEPPPAVPQAVITKSDSLRGTAVSESSLLLIAGTIEVRRFLNCILKATTPSLAPPMGSQQLSHHLMRQHQQQQARARNFSERILSTETSSEMNGIPRFPVSTAPVPLILSLGALALVGGATPLCDVPILHTPCGPPLRHAHVREPTLLLRRVRVAVDSSSHPRQDSSAARNVPLKSTPVESSPGDVGLRTPPRSIRKPLHPVMEPPRDPQTNPSSTQMGHSKDSINGTAPKRTERWELDIRGIIFPQQLIRASQVLALLCSRDAERLAQRGDSSSHTSSGDELGPLVLSLRTRTHPLTSSLSDPHTHEAILRALSNSVRKQPRLAQDMGIAKCVEYWYQNDYGSGGAASSHSSLTDILVSRTGKDPLDMHLNCGISVQPWGSLSRWDAHVLDGWQPSDALRALAASRVAPEQVEEEIRRLRELSRFRLLRLLAAGIARSHSGFGLHPFLDAGEDFSSLTLVSATLE